MVRTPMFTAAAALLFLAAEVAPVSAQDTEELPDFSGSWTTTTDTPTQPTGRRGGRGGRGGFAGLGPAATIVQDENTLTITRTAPAGRAGQAGEIVSTYNLDGSPSTNTLSFGGNSVEQTSTATWNERKLLITTSMSFGGNARETTMALSLDDDGQLVVESTMPGRGGGAAATATTTYTKGG